MPNRDFYMVAVLVTDHPASSERLALPRFMVHAMSSTNMPDLFATDSLTYVLGFTAAVAFLLRSFLTPQSLVHPILLGRQSDVDQVRQPGESAVYRNYGTGLMGRLPTRPAGGIMSILDFLKPDFTASRSLWSTDITNAKLQSRIASLSAGLVHEAGLQPKESNVLLLLNDGLEFVIADFALASQAIPSFTISSLTLLSSFLDTHPPTAIILHVHSLSHVLEQIAENSEYVHHTLILVGEGDLPHFVEKLPLKILWLADLERKGAKGEAIQALSLEPEDIFSVSCYPGPNDELKATQLTHQNLTAGVAATRALFPLSGAIAPSDSIVSSHSLSTPFGRAVAYTALYEGCHFSTSDSTAVFAKDGASSKADDKALKYLTSTLPSPTIAFLTPSQMNGIVSSVLSLAQNSLLYSFAWRHKLLHLQNGFLSKDSIWDRSVFAGARKAVLRGMADSLRAVIISGGMVEAKLLTPTRITLSIPIVNAHEHPLVAGPVFFSHPLDFQSFKAASQLADIAHVGPASINVEAKLVGVDDTEVDKGADPVGEIFIRGPSVTLPLEGETTPHNWVGTGEKGLVQTNGTFKVITAPKYHI
ncbi:hypothetical protein EW145_g2865 [Phellinidium pouzarii]|uniref:AMP-dependent synthetase/ligase domain-containing protein n=1 Tax=Phellinidium pouzarii TaxID=167371 RepID=A0A4S4L9P9_9AGAM|nr:hypothetical protein EW145_g2865 [Phellinidium pouzarii]